LLPSSCQDFVMCVPQHEGGLSGESPQRERLIELPGDKTGGGAESCGYCSSRRARQIEWNDSLPCHSWSIPRISRAQSNSTDPGGNSVRSSKKLDSTFSMAKGATCQSKLRSSRPSNSPGL